MDLNDRQSQREEKLKEIYEEARERSTQELALQYNLPYINLKRTPIEVWALELVPEQAAREAYLVPFQKKGNSVALAVLNPQLPQAMQIISQLKTQGFQVELFVASKASLDFAWEKYKLVPPPRTEISNFINVSDYPLVLFKDLNQYLSQLDSRNITTILSIILKSAMEADASDIHLDPLEKEALLKFRIDGLLFDVGSLNLNIYKALRDRIKLLGSLKINLQNIPQDGRFTIQNKNVIFEVRVASIPGPNGEFLTLRLLNPSRAQFGLKDLGIDDQNVKLVQALLSSPNGMILATGPTGSGKTTTLYTLIKQKISPGINIITIEDPIEYKIKGVNQTQVDIKKGYDFSNGLRSIVRQDPDVILVGEIRDAETAKIAIQASLTGHLVFSTLHTNEASGAVSRLKEMGIDKDIIPDALKLVIGQRLVRKLCPYCKEKYQPQPELIKSIQEALSILSPRSGVKISLSIPTLYKAKGCEKCNWLGYKGQIGLFEFLFLNEDINDLVRQNAGVDEIREEAINEGMVPLFHDGLLKVLEGITSLEEITRVAGDIDYVKMLYSKLIAQSLTRGITISKDEYDLVKQNLTNLTSLQSIMQNAKTEDAFRLICALGLVYNATDIHLEPQENKSVVRYRIDGLLQEKLYFPLEMHSFLIQFVKNLAGLEAQETQQIQEGRFNIDSVNGSQDVRISLVPSGYGESLVMRLLKKDIRILGLTELGILPEFLPIIKQASQKPNGIILGCGPTSSGKTTTIYAILSNLNKPEVKIMTIEDPIEYRLPGIVQTNVNPKEGYTFSTALRGFLRQNPNIILVGEIRDTETAKIAIQASLTGHLILSTLHTQDCLTAITRLENFQITPSEIASSLNIIIAQRLVRKLCPYCKEEIVLNKSQKEIIDKAFAVLPKNIYQKFEHYLIGKNRIYQAKGCEKCNYSGYSGITGIFEILTINEELRKLISQNVQIDVLKKAIEVRALSLLQDGLIKVLGGFTSWEELQRVLGTDFGAE